MLYYLFQVTAVHYTHKYLRDAKAESELTQPETVGDGDAVGA